ncbi:hypothetical protein [Xylophilus sp.]|uniref:hypothetical protein n=1 Tax=Xylophilus sp. TaxID=2653893 RepID=UPI0013BDA521|nr:hypothetical protein [Xylophilus sp.]KAF1045841.1 MAG: hypothetical protein GAK38_02828 [Xylophilus sp.]
MGLHQLSLQYVAEQDRLLLRVSATSGAEVRCWLTRRLALRFAPALRDQVAQLSALRQSLPATVSEEARRMAAEFESQRALEGAVFGQPYMPPPNAQQPLGDAPLLVTEIDVATTQDQQLALSLREKLDGQVGEPRGFRVTLEPQTMHALLKLLKGALDQADWDSAQDFKEEVAQAAARILPGYMH